MISYCFAGKGQNTKTRNKNKIIDDDILLIEKQLSKV
jgi:hypothetical protein